MNMEFHPIANIFPLIEGQAYQDLMADVLKHGVREPVWLYEGQILDGRNRYRAATAMGVECPMREYDGDEPVQFVVSLNLHRRHLSESQRAMVAARLSTLGQGERADRSIDPSTTQAQAAEMLNVSVPSIKRAKVVVDGGSDELKHSVESGRVSVSAAADVATLPKEQQTEIVARGEREILMAAKEIRAGKAEVRRAERMDTIATISKGNAPLGTVAERYPVLYVDPPWRYEHAESESRAIENQYPTMTLDEIKAMPLDDIAYADCVLFMWATSPKLAEAFEVLAAWGFSYRTCAVWDKQKIGMGYYFRQQHELLLIAVRGQPPTPAPADRPSSVFSYPRGQHSAKPHEVYEIIESMYPSLPKLEMFCRTPREGWGVWGNQSEAA